MAPFMEDVRFAVLSANIRPDDSLAATFGVSCQPYKIFTVGGEKVAVVGYTSQETPALSRPGKSRFIISVPQTDHFLPLTGGDELPGHISSLPQLGAFG